MVRLFVHVFGVLWVATFAVLAATQGVNPWYEAITLLIVLTLWRIWTAIRMTDV